MRTTHSLPMAAVLECFRERRTDIHRCHWRTNAGANLNALHNSKAEFPVNLHFLTAGLLNRLYFRYVCLMQFCSQNSQFSQTELCSRLQVSLYAFDFIKFCGSCCPFFVSVTAHSLCQLLSILYVSYCQFFVSVTVHSLCQLLSILCVSCCLFFVSVIVHSLCQFLSILCVSYCPFFLSVTAHYLCQLLSILCVSYCPFFVPVTAHSLCQLLPILCLSYFPFCWDCYCPSCGCVTAHFVGVTVHVVSVTANSACLLLPISRGLLLSILRVCYCPFCGSITTHSVGYRPF